MSNAPMSKNNGLTGMTDHVAQSVHNENHQVAANDSMQQSEISLVSTNSNHKSNQVRNRVLTRKRKRSRHPLRELRIQSGYTLEELAELTRLSPSYLSRLESGTRRLNADVLQRLALVLSCHPGDLLPHESQSNKSSQSWGTQNSSTSSRSGPTTFPQDLPLYKMSCNDNMSSVIDFTSSQEWIARPPELLGVAGAFAFFVTDKTVSSRYRAGDRVYAHPTYPLSPNCSMIAITHDNQAYIGRFSGWQSEENGQSAKLIIDTSDGSDNSSNNVTLEQDQIKATYRIIGLMEAA